MGRWIPSANHLRRDAAFPGSYFETMFTNTTSIYVVLNNVYVPRPASNTAPAHAGDNHQWELHPPTEHEWAAQQVNLIAEIESDDWSEAIIELHEASSVMQIAKDLNPDKNYKLIITYMGCSSRNGGTSGASYDEVLEFEGLWLDRPVLQDMSHMSRATNASRSSTLGELQPIASRKRAVIELITSERPYSHAQPAQEKVNTWYNTLGRGLFSDVALLETARSRLVANDIAQVTIQNLFFQSAPEATSHLSRRPWSFGSYQPTVLLLQFGMSDFVHSFSNTANGDHHARDKFFNDFVEAYMRFVKAIRANAYPVQTRRAPDPTHDPTHSPMALDDDGSYVYNSAPSTLPIFLVPPFSSCRRFVNNRLTLHKIVSDAIAQATLRLQADGDKSTYWIDTTGWLDVKDDFSSTGRGWSPDPDTLTAAANVKVARYLAHHICKHVSFEKDDPNYGILGDCPFERYDNYLGNVYVPKEVELDRVVLERKIEHIKQKFMAAQESMDMESLR